MEEAPMQRRRPTPAVKVVQAMQVELPFLAEALRAPPVHGTSGRPTLRLIYGGKPKLRGRDQLRRAARRERLRLMRGGQDRQRD
jgi:hypothetical protein